MVNKKLEFEELKIEWEHNRATEFNYTIGLITMLMLGLKYWVIDSLKYPLTPYQKLVTIFPIIIALLATVGGYIVHSIKYQPSPTKYITWGSIIVLGLFGLCIFFTPSYYEVFLLTFFSIVISIVSFIAISIIFYSMIKIKNIQKRMKEIIG